MLKGVLMFIIGVILASISQILLKISANKHRGSDTFSSQYINLWVISAYTIFFLTTIISVIALRWLTVSIAAILETLAQICTGFEFFFIKRAYFFEKGNRDNGYRCWNGNCFDVGE